MKTLTVTALIAFAAVGPVDSAATIFTLTTTTITMTRAGAHYELNNLNRSGKKIVADMSRCNCAECVKNTGVMIK